MLKTKFPMKKEPKKIFLDEKNDQDKLKQNQPAQNQPN